MSHGGDIYWAEVEFDFSANINPLGMPKSAVFALRKGVLDFEAYPDPECRKLKRALAEKEGVSPENIVCGNGASDLIYRLAHVLAPKRAIVTAPTFSEYEKALTEAGAEIDRFYLSEEKDFRLDESFLERIPERGAVFLASPNNPDGGVIGGELFKKIKIECGRKGSTFILDECFADFAKTENAPRPDVSIKAFTKIYAMAGLRLGYIVCGGDLAKKISDYGPCWSVSTPAQTAALAALGEKDFIEKTRSFIKKEREFLSRSLTDAGLKVFPSEANYLLFKAPKGLDAALLERKILLRRCGDYHGLGAEFYRTAVRTRRENEILVKNIEEILPELN